MRLEGANGYIDRVRRAGLRTLALPLLALAIAGMATVACGSRSSLDDITYVLRYGNEAGVDGADLDGPDSPGDDGTLDGDGPSDAPGDRIADAHRDVVVLTNCPDPSSTYIYVVTEQKELLSFYPPTAAFMSIGTLACPTADSTATPYSMAVDRRGTAYVLYNDGELFRVSTRTVRCTATSFASTPTFSQFGMGFAADSNGTTDTLYVAPSAAGVLGTIGIPAFNTNVVGSLPLQDSELTGTGDGRLFAFYSAPASMAIAQLDRSNANVLSNTNLPSVQHGVGWAFAFWGGDFYLFTAPSGTSQVTRFRPSDRSEVVVATLPNTIVGAGVSTCAPQI